MSRKVSARASTKSVYQERPVKMSRKSVLSRVSSKTQGVSRNGVQQECQASFRASFQECPARSFKSVNQEGQARVSAKVPSKSAQQECPVKSVQQECQARVSFQECQARVSIKSAKQEYPARVSRKTVLSRVSSQSV